MLASSFLDPVLGIDIHFEMVPTPVPVPTPIPNPFIGLVFDPIGLGAGLVMAAAVSAVMGAPILGPVTYWTIFPATNTGTEAKHVTGHILIPPGVAWAPFPKTPKPVIHPGETPKPALPVKPENDAVMITGSKTVSVMGSNAVRLGDIALSCSEPLRLPSSVVLAIPKGAPILIGGPPSLDIMAALFASLRTRFVSDSLHALVSRMKPSRFRNLLHRGVCFFTGHPVDVATGKVMTEFIDTDLPGPLPLKIERIYSSAFAARPGPLGHGWSLSVDQGVWRERGKVVLLSEDGREVEFDTLDLPGHRMQVGQSIYHPIERLTLYCDKDGGWRVTAADGVTRYFASIPDRADGRAMLSRIRSRCGYHEIGLHYDRTGRLEWIRDSGGRTLRLRYDERGRIIELNLPRPQGEGFYCHRRYHYDAQGDLAEVVDSRGHSWRFAYVTHLLVRETDRNGLSFYFAYDGLGEDAWCVRTWGDGGIRDHVLSYDKHGRVTYVTDSFGHTTQYRMNVAGQVMAKLDPLGGETKYEYDQITLQRTKIVEPDGAIVRYEYDGRGNRVGFVAPDGAQARYEFHATWNCPVSAIDFAGNQWRWSYDTHGRVCSCRPPAQEAIQFYYEGGYLAKTRHPGGAASVSQYDAQGNLVSVTVEDAGSARTTFDRLGRPTATRLPAGETESYAHDLEGHLTQLKNDFGLNRRSTYDAEGNLLSVREPACTATYAYIGSGRLAEHARAGAVTRFVYDSEQRLVEVVHPSGARHVVQRDPRGVIVSERRFDGAYSKYASDRSGRLVAVERSSGSATAFTYDAAGRLKTARHNDGTGEAYEYRADGVLLSAANESASVSFIRDPLGRVLEERTRRPGGSESWVRNAYGPDGMRVRTETSDGHVHRIDRDRLGHATRVEVDESRWRVTFDRDATGLEVSRKSSSGAAVRWEHDALGRPTRRTVVGSRRSFIRETTYQWADDSRVRAIQDDVSGRVEYGYDPRGDLREVRHEDGSVEIHALDDRGDLHRDLGRSDREFDRGGRLLRDRDTVFRYDPDGRLVEVDRGDGRRTKYHWSGSGMLREVVLPDGRCVSFTYDALARRLSRTVTPSAGEARGATERHWVWSGNNPITEHDSAHGKIHWLFEPETFQPLAQAGPTGVHDAFPSPVGGPTLWTDEVGDLEVDVEVDLTGRLVVEPTSRAAPPWGWQGHYHDEETGLAYNRFRYYHPKLGSYISPDPIGLLGGLQMRAYVPDPLTAADPLGLEENYRPWQIHSPGYNDVVQKGLHFYGPGHIELAVRPDHKGGITFTNAIPGDAADPRLAGAIKAAADRFENNPAFRADILAKARGGITSTLGHAKDLAGTLRALAQGRSREMRDIVRNIERRDGGGGCK